MYMKSLVSLAVLGAMSAVATAGDHVVFDKPNESYTVDGLNKYGATINASDITITNTTYNGIDAYGVFDLNAANDISIQGATNGIFTPTDHENSSITITTPKKLTITGPWAIHAEGKGTITIDAGDLVLRGSNGIAANSTGTVSIDAQTVDIASTNKYGVSSANTGGVKVFILTHPQRRKVHRCSLRNLPLRAPSIQCGYQAMSPEGVPRYTQCRPSAPSPEDSSARRARTSTDIMLHKEETCP